MKTALILLPLLVLSHGHLSRADIGGPNVAHHALSPDGNTLVRIKTAERVEQSTTPPKHVVSYYGFDATNNAYVHRSGFELTGELPQMLYVSNQGDLIFVSLSETEAIRIYAKEGQLIKSMDLDDFLTEDEVQACAETGSTLQWIEEGMFFDRTFYLRGPSQLIRALSPPYTVMRAPNQKVSFTAIVHTKDGTFERLGQE